ncbi:hypothetical protein [Paraburkholderia sp. Ac-20342]|nr:hypothetical protein [Paraburkholderia sp. Ac-20342]
MADYRLTLAAEANLQLPAVVTENDLMAYRVADDIAQILNVLHRRQQ